MGQIKIDSCLNSILLIFEVVRFLVEKFQDDFHMNPTVIRNDIPLPTSVMYEKLVKQNVLNISPEPNPRVNDTVFPICRRFSVGLYLEEIKES
ncbi:hypothetical protein [Leptospira interrogans]|nr:hypothetical protein [Leptospira interrogans]ULG85056.1 hypothetical protein FH594_04265 [Leptospira interrogans]